MKRTHNMLLVAMLLGAGRGAIAADVFPVPAKSTGVVLKDGTRLSGVLRKHTKESTLVRTTSLGLLEFKRSEIAALFFADDFAKRVVRSMKDPVVIKRDGAVLSGKILWVTDASTGIKTKDGLKRINASDMAALYYAPFPSVKKLVLRNGDVINAQVDYKDTHVEVTIGGVTRKLSLRAIHKNNGK